LLTLEEIEAEFERYRIATSFDLEAGGLFSRALPGFAEMPAAVRAGHAVASSMVLRGEGQVDGAETFMGRAIAALFRLPRASASVPVTVTMEARGEQEIWSRDFGGRRFRSVLAARKGGLSERFGLLTFDLTVPTSPNGLTMSIIGWRIGPVRLPASLAPATLAREDVDGHGRFRFDVTIALPFVGRLVRYRGWLVPEATNFSGMDC
jgi:hypothetical protein